MLIGVFKSNQKLVNGLVVLLTVLLWISSCFMEYGNEGTNFISTGAQLFDVIISITLISIQAIYLNIIVNEYKLVENNSHITSLMFVIFNSCFPLMFGLNEVVIANTFVLLGIHQLLRLYDTKGGFALSFNAGLLISVATVIYLPNGVFLLFLWFGLIYMISPKWRDFVITLIGFSIPIIYVVSYNFVFGDLSTFELKSYVFGIFNMTWEELSMFGKSLVFMISGLILLALLRVTNGLNNGALRTRKMFVVIIFMVFFGMGTLLLNGADFLATFVVLTVPLSIIVANFFQEIKKQWMAELLFMSLLGIVIINYFL